MSQSEVVSDSEKGVSGIVDVFGNVLSARRGHPVRLGLPRSPTRSTSSSASGCKALALLRAIGASPGQVFRSVMGEALVVGVASVIGLALGIGIAVGAPGRASPGRDSGTTLVSRPARS